MWHQLILWYTLLNEGLNYSWYQFLKSYHYFSRLWSKPSPEFMLLLMSESTEVKIGERACWGDGCWTASLYEAEKCALAAPTSKWWLLRPVIWRRAGISTVYCWMDNWSFCSTIIWFLHMTFQLVFNRTGSSLLCGKMYIKSNRYTEKCILLWQMPHVFFRIIKNRQLPCG